MASLGLYDSPDSTTEALQKFPHTRLAKCLSVRLFHGPDLRHLDLDYDKIKFEDRDVETIFTPVA